MREKFISVVVSSVVFLLLANSVRGQISITSGGFSYSQNFNTLTTNTTAQSWTDNTATTALDSPRVVGLSGWYAAAFASAGAATTNGNNNQIRGGNGSSSSGSFYSYGNDGSSDRALGTLPIDGITGTGAGALRLGVRFVNNSGGIITGFTFSYDGEQWRASSTNVNNNYTVGYSLFSAGQGTLANPYTSTLGTFDTPIDGLSVASALDGNASANRIAGLGDTISGIVFNPGDELWIRWSDANSTSLDQGIAIDNFAVTFAVPEPSSVALIGMGAGLLWYQIRRRK